MIERIGGAPAGVIALRSSGKLSKTDYTDVLDPALREAVESGGVRLVFVIEDYDGLESGVWIEDMKTGLQAWVKDHSTWRRFALVTDVEWIARAVKAFSWMAPGEVKVYGRADEAAATEWVAG